MTTRTHDARAVVRRVHHVRAELDWDKLDSVERARAGRHNRSKKRDVAATVSKAIAHAWTDPGFKEKLIKDPRAALAEHGVEAPAGTTMKVVENTSDTQHLVLPTAPDKAGEVSMAELETACRRSGARLLQGVLNPLGFS